VLIALSGYGSPQDRDAALAAGFAGYMVKPFDEAALRPFIAPAPQPSSASAGS
jgi:CheY-like chemotaxis protein